MDRWQELSRRKAEQDTRREVVLADAVGKLKILIEHGPEGKRYGLA